MEIKQLGHRGAIFAAGGVIVSAALAAYHGSFSGPFLFDDVRSIATNPTLRHLWPLGPVLSPNQGGLTTSGRPMLNLSFALNYAVSGTRVGSYHAVNLLIHILAGLTLFGIVRRTLEKVGTGGPPVLGRPQGHAETTDGRAARPYPSTLVAFTVALIWTVHPLQTESVTYIVQRAESLMGLFYLLTLYGFIRAADDSNSGFRLLPRRSAAKTGPPPAASKRSEDGSPWLWLSAGACLLGMATKEVMVSAPVIVLLYDRTFVSGSFRDAWRRRRAYYLCLAATWIPLTYFVLSTNNRGGTAGLDAGAAVSAWSYRLEQFPAMVHYLALAVWPHPLTFDYGVQVPRSAAQVAPAAVIVLGLLAGTIWALSVRRSSAKRHEGGQALSFAGAWFFAILAPTSLVPVVVQTMAEHRMYLALAPVVAVVVCGGYFLFERFLNKTGLLLVLVLAVALAFMTSRRNEDYQSAVALWHSTLAASPTNPRAWYDQGIALHQAGNDAAAIESYREALRLEPNSPEFNNNLGVTLAAGGRWPEAIASYEQALRFRPDYAEAHSNLGMALAAIGREPEAMAQYRQAAQLDPQNAVSGYILGRALAKAGRTSEAIAQYERVLQLNPDFTKARSGLADALNDRALELAQSGQLEPAVKQFEEASRLQPDDAEISDNLGLALAAEGHLPEAAADFEKASRLQPGNAEFHDNLGSALAQMARMAEARSQFEEALRLKPDDPEARANLARMRELPQGSNEPSANR